MRLIIEESFANLVLLFVVLANGLSFLKNGVFTICKSRYQRILQSIHFAAILFILSYEAKILEIVYIQGLKPLETVIFNVKLKLLQYVGEIVLTSTIIFSFVLILESFKNFKIKNMTGRILLKYSCILYGTIRLFIFLYPLSHILMSIKYVAFYSFLIEIFLITEFFILIFVFACLRETIKKLEKEVEICLMNDKSYIQYILSMMKSMSIRFMFASFLQCIYRIMYLSVFFNARNSQVLMILRDFSSFFKILSVHLILDNINNLIIFNDPTAVAKCEENSTDKFFLFEEELNQEQKQEV